MKYEIWFYRIDNEKIFSRYYDTLKFRTFWLFYISFSKTKYRLISYLYIHINTYGWWNILYWSMIPYFSIYEYEEIFYEKRSRK